MNLPRTDLVLPVNCSHLIIAVVSQLVQSPANNSNLVLLTPEELPSRTPLQNKTSSCLL